MNLDSVFNPRSIAIVGASGNKDKLGHQLLKKVLTTKNLKVYPVNPKANKILGIKAYPDLTQIPGAVDQAIIVIPAPFVESVLKQASLKQVKSVIVVTAGFSETGAEGKKLEAKLKTELKKSSIALVGPNCLGYANPKQKLDITFAKTPPPPGNIALISQSGAVGSFLFDWAKKENLGFSKFASLGNRAGINESDCLQFLAKDKETKVVTINAQQTGPTPQSQPSPACPTSRCLSDGHADLSKAEQAIDGGEVQGQQQSVVAQYLRLPNVKGGNSDQQSGPQPHAPAKGRLAQGIHKGYSQRTHHAPEEAQGKE